MRAAGALGGRQRGRCRVGSTFGQLLDLAGQLGSYAKHRIEQLGARAFRGRSAEYGFRMLEGGVPAERHVAKTEERKQAHACFYAASTEYSEHRCIVGRTR